MTPPVTDVREMVERLKGLARSYEVFAANADTDTESAAYQNRAVLFVEAAAALESLASHSSKEREEAIEEAARTTYEAPRDPNHRIRVRGVGRISDEPRALLLALTERPTDDEIRALHDFFSQRPMLDAIRALPLPGK